ncbi:hypothetical protein [Amycolatopsis thermoflava]|uniref:hypothetical protein n=1 Tax=Amycolatopsis thermoflava TaxID=84480 RepID=UPI000429FD20|nr:hypothetical protein [Amycolatopsis thermoflava]
MAVSAPLTLNENNDEEILATLTTNQPSSGTPLDLTGKTLEVFLKAGADTADVDGWKGQSTGGSPAITVTNAAAGQVSIMVPAAQVTTTVKWWRLDVLSGALRKTALYGAVTVNDM